MANLCLLLWKAVTTFHSGQYYSNRIYLFYPIRTIYFLWPLYYWRRQKRHTFRFGIIADLDLPIHWSTSMAVTIKINFELSPKIVRGRVLKTMNVSAHAQNHVSLEWDGKSVTTMVLGDHDFLLRVSNVGDLAAFRSIFFVIFSQRMRRKGYLWVSSENLTAEFDSLTPIIFTDNDISAIWRPFLLIVHSICWMSTILLLSVYLS